MPSATRSTVPRTLVHGSSPFRQMDEVHPSSLTSNVKVADSGSVSPTSEDSGVLELEMLLAGKPAPGPVASTSSIKLSCLYRRHSDPFPFPESQPLTGRRPGLHATWPGLRVFTTNEFLAPSALRDDDTWRRSLTF